MSVTRTTIKEWTVEGSGTAVPAHIRAAGRVPATVPGSVHTDLMSLGLLPDPYLDENEKTQSWIGLADWTYRATVPWRPDGHDRQDLVFEGVDTVATIRLNGKVIAETRNMHRSYRIDVTDSLITGDNQLEVRIASPIRAADRASLELGYRPHVNHHPYNSIRKMACSFGWDWGIDTSTSALWKPVHLESWSSARLAEVRVAGDVVRGVPVLNVHIEVDDPGGGPLEVAVAVGESITAIPLLGGAGSAHISLPSAALWWPRGYGSPALHDAEITLRAGDDVLEVRRYRVGFRSVGVRTKPDESGVGFEIVVNGQIIQVRGANWIPDDAFLHRVTRERYSRRLDQAEFANINLLRVWGGGIYETEDFYSECDERGLLTWQDFLLACAAYAEEEPLRSEIEAEVREAIARIGTHPSLVVFNGNNENVIAFQDWGWKKRLEGRTWGSGYYYEMFPGLVAELAPHVAYTPGSPFSPDPAAPQNDDAQGTVHIWDVWNQLDWTHYREHQPRFVAEFGWQGPPAWSTLLRSISDDPLTPESPGMLVHQKALGGNEKLIDGLTTHFPLPDDMSDWHWAMSLNQARAIRTAIEWFRSLPDCTGSIVWQLNDCWPVTSWAAVDGDERPKPLLYALRHANADRLVTIQPTGDGGLRAAVVNDTSDTWTGELVIERTDYAGRALSHEVSAIRVAPWSVADVRLSDDAVAPQDATAELIVARLGSSVAHWFFTEDRDSALERIPCEAKAERAGDGWDITITAKALAKDVMILADKLDPSAVVDEGLHTLMPGESVVVHLSGAVNPEAVSERDVLRTANDLVAAHREPSLS